MFVTDQAIKKLKRWALIAAEIALAIIIMGLLIATWLPALIGPHSLGGRN